MASATRALRERNFRLLFIGQTVSSIGNTLVPVALAFGVLRITHSANDLGLILGSAAIAQIVFLLAGGVIADRFSRRGVMLKSDALRFASQGVLGGLLIVGHPAVATMAALAAIPGAAGALFQPASSGLLPALVSEENLQAANSLSMISASGSAIVGPALAGVLVVAVGAGWAIVADAASYAVSVLFLARLRLDVIPRSTRQRFVADLRDGWDVVRSHTWFWACLLSGSICSLFYASFTVFGPVAALRFYNGAATWAAMATSGGIGAVVGGFLAIRIHPLHPLRIGIILLLPFTLPAVALGLRLPVFGLVAIAALASGGNVIFQAIFLTTMQQRMPEESLSRASSFDWFATLATYPIGLAIAGPLVVLIGLRTVLFATGLIEFVVLAGLLLVPQIRHLEATGDGRADASGGFTRFEIED